MAKNALSYLLRVALIVIGIPFGAIVSSAPITWIGGNANWDATITQWNPNDEPDADDEAIFNTPNTVNLANASESIMALSMSGGIDLLLNGNDLTVNGGNVTLSGASTLLDAPTNSTLNTDDVFVNADASLTLHGGTITMAQSGGDAVLTVAAGGAVGGYGTINSSDAIATANTTVLSLGGNLVVTSFDLFSVGAATLSINLPANGRVDLDQTGAVVDITRNDTLDINGAAHDPAIDAYSGTMNLSEGATLDMSNAWGMNAGSINVNTNGVNVNTAGAAATIAGGELTQTGGTINLADNLDSLRFTAPYTATGGTINNNGTIIFDAGGSSSISGAEFQMTGAGASITVTDGTGGGVNSVTIRQGNFDLAGAGNDTTNVTTVGTLGAPGARGVLNVYMDFDSGVGDVLDQRIELNGGLLNFVNEDFGFAGTDTTWHLSGGVVNANSFASLLDGSDLIIQAETINIAAGCSLSIATSSVEITNPTINISGALVINAPSRWTNSAVSVTGSGGLSTLYPGIVTIGNGPTTADVVWSVTTVAWDSVGSTTIDPGSSLTINADRIDFGSDGYDSTLNINSSDLTVNTPGAWRMESVLNIDNVSAIPTINGSPMIVGDANGATVNVGANGGAGVHRMNAPLTIETNGVVNVSAGATFQVDGNTIFDGGQVTGDGNYVPASGNIVNGESRIDVAQFNFDRGSWTINPGAELVVHVGDYDSDNGTNSFNSTITINSGVLSMGSDDPVFVVDAAAINMIKTTEQFAIWVGDPIEFGNDAGAFDTDLNVSGGVAAIGAPVTFLSDTDVNINAGGELFLSGETNFNSVNGANNASFTGSGWLMFLHTTNFNEVTTLDVANIDLDGVSVDFLNPGFIITVNADTTINADQMRSFGHVTVDGVDHVLTLNGFASLTVNLSDPDDEWFINSPAVVNINASGDPFIGSGINGSDVNVNGTVNVSGNSGWNARVDLAGRVNTTLAGDFIRFGGGSLADPNRLVGGTITGPGTLGALDNDALVGFGTIDTTIQFLGNSELLADDGALHITGLIANVGTIGTADADGILIVTNPWNTNQADTVFLEGGELRGAPINISANGIRGHGQVLAQVSNDGRVQAEGSGLLIVQTPNNLNDWDGAVGNGQLNALTANMEIRDNAAFPFSGSVSVAEGHNLFVNGFELEFQPGSTLALQRGTYRSSHTTHIGGAVTVAAGGPSTLQIAGTAIFENGSSATLNDDLQLNNPTTAIQVGATFTGSASLINLPGVSLIAENNATVDVKLENRGNLVIGTSPGQLHAANFVQTADGTLQIELGGTGSGQFDRLIVDGQAVLGGTLQVSLLLPYVPSWGDMIEILSATGGLVGTTFATELLPTLNGGLYMDVVYLPDAVSLEVRLQGDFDFDGDVDGRDFLIWQRGGSPNGINSGDLALWQARYDSTLPLSANVNAVPEPAGISLVLAVLICVSGYQRKWIA